MTSRGDICIDTSFSSRCHSCGDDPNISAVSFRYHPRLSRLGFRTVPIRGFAARDSITIPLRVAGYVVANATAPIAYWNTSDNGVAECRPIHVDRQMPKRVVRDRELMHGWCNHPHGIQPIRTLTMPCTPDIHESIGVPDIDRVACWH